MKRLYCFVFTPIDSIFKPNTNRKAAAARRRTSQNWPIEVVRLFPGTSYCFFKSLNLPYTDSEYLPMPLVVEPGVTTIL